MKEYLFSFVGLYLFNYSSKGCFHLKIYICQLIEAICENVTFIHVTQKWLSLMIQKFTLYRNNNQSMTK